MSAAAHSERDGLGASGESPPAKLAIIANNPIQHFVPLYRGLSQAPELNARVLFCSRMGLEPYFDVQMNTQIAWKMDLTSGYDHLFLEEAGRAGEVPTMPQDNPSVSSALSAFDPDVVAIYGYATRTARRALVWARLRGRPVLLISDSELIGRRTLVRRLAKEIPLRLLVRAVCGFLTVGDHNEAYWKSFGARATQLFRTPFTIDEALYVKTRQDRDAIRKTWREAHGVDETEVVFLCVGKLYPSKRQGDVVEAIRRVQAQIGGAQSVRLLLAGNGPEMAALEAVAKASGAPVLFLGFVNVDELPAVYAAADVLVHPSQRDAHPLVLSEGGCIGLPFIVSDKVGAVGASDIAQPGRNTIVYPCGDLDRLTEAMAALAADPDRREAMAQASLEIYATQNMAASVAGVVKAVAHATRRRGPG